MERRKEPTSAPATLVKSRDTDVFCGADQRPGFVRLENGHARAVLAFGLEGERIEAVFVSNNPDKLRHLQQA